MLTFVSFRGIEFSLKQKSRKGQKQNLGDKTDYAADGEDPLPVVAHNARDPDRAEGSQGDEGLGILFVGFVTSTFGLTIV